MSALAELLEANASYAAAFRSGDLSGTPARRVAILTCMDARLDPLAFAGLRLGDAHIIRNAGGRASDDAIRSLVVSYKLLDTAEWFVVHHTGCGMEQVTDEGMRELLGSSEAADVSWLGISDPLASVSDDVDRIRRHPLVPARISVHGLMYDVASGRLSGVPGTEAATAG